MWSVSSQRKYNFYHQNTLFNTFRTNSRNIIGRNPSMVIPLLANQDLTPMLTGLRWVQAITFEWVRWSEYKLVLQDQSGKNHPQIQSLNKNTGLGSCTVLSVCETSYWCMNPRILYCPVRFGEIVLYPHRFFDSERWNISMLFKAILIHIKKAKLAKITTRVKGSNGVDHICGWQGSTDETLAFRNYIDH